MNVAIGVWTLVLGGVLIPGAEPPVGEPSISTQGPIVDFELLYPGAGAESAYPELGLGYPQLDPGAAGRRMGYPMRRPGAPGPGQVPDSGLPAEPPPAPYFEPTGTARSSMLEDPLIPYAPTDPSAASGAYPWGPPTAGSPLEDPNQGQRPMVSSPSGRAGLRLSGSSAYLRPRAGRPAYRGYSPYGSAPPQQGAGVSLPNFPGVPSHSPSGRIAKPDFGYRQAPAVSPYMALGARTSEYNDIDNYSQYVKPRLEQLDANRRVGGQIRGLQNSVRTLGQETRSVRGTVIPHYYMNYGGYYPGFRR